MLSAHRGVPIVVNVITILLIILASLLVLEVVARITSVHRAVLRKIVHVGMSFLVTLIAMVAGYAPFVIVGLVFTVLLLVLRKVFPLEALSDRAKDSYGEIFFPLGVSFAAVMSNSTMDFITTILILGVADTMAYLVGTHTSSVRLVFGKTLFGSLAFFITALLLCLLIVPLPIALVVALSATIAELLSPKGYDNLTVPVITSLIFSALL